MCIVFIRYNLYKLIFKIATLHMEPTIAMLPFIFNKRHLFTHKTKQLQYNTQVILNI
jgi:hypothetical protein